MTGVEKAIGKAPNVVLSIKLQTIIIELKNQELIIILFFFFTGFLVPLNGHIIEVCSSSDCMFQYNFCTIIIFNYDCKMNQGNSYEKPAI